MCDLNEYVLRETFNHLNLRDMSDMADVCSTYRRVAQDVYKLRHQTAHFQELGEFDDARKTVFIGKQYWFSFLRKFGNVTPSLSILGGRNQLSLLEAIAMHCSVSPCIEEINVTTVTWTSDLIAKWEPLLLRLRKFKLYWSSFDDADASHMLSFCLRLQSLTIFAMASMDFASRVILPRLQSLAIGDVEWTDEMMLNWQPTLAHLKELKLFNFKGVDVSQLLALCGELCSLSFSCGENLILASPIALPHLKSLLLDVDLAKHTTVVERLLVSNPQLDEIELRRSSTRGMIEMVGRYVTNVAKLEFTYEGSVDATGTKWQMPENVKSLVINCHDSARVGEVLKAVANTARSSEHLGVRIYGPKSQIDSIEEFVIHCSKFRKLREFDFKFHGDLPFHHIVVIVRKLPMLRKLTLDMRVLPPATGIQEIVEGAPMLQSLTCAHSFDNDL